MCHDPPSVRSPGVSPPNCFVGRLARRSTRGQLDRVVLAGCRPERRERSSRQSNLFCEFGKRQNSAKTRKLATREQTRHNHPCNHSNRRYARAFRNERVSSPSNGPDERSNEGLQRPHRGLLRPPELEPTVLIRRSPFSCPAGCNGVV